MAYTIVDRRKNGKGKSSVNRQKLLKRSKAAVKEAVKKIVQNGNISDIVNKKKNKISIPSKDLDEPQFQHGKGGNHQGVRPGNKEFVQGDRIKKPEQGEGNGRGQEGSPDGDGEDDFNFHLSQEEFLDVFFEDLELPDLQNKDIVTVEEFKNKRVGFSINGNPSQLNVLRSMRQSKGRKFALLNPKKRKLKELEQELELLDKEIEQRQLNGADCSLEKDKRDKIVHEIESLKRKIKAIPFLHENDLRYNKWTKVPVPTTKAVMFAVMDVSGSMGEFEKEMAKRFYMLLYLFLHRQYEKVDIVFIRHHTTPKEVEEEEFFYSKETGGTIVSPALELMDEIIKERYPLNEWNIYGCQASDGDNWSHDSVKAEEILKQTILPIAQYFAYIEIKGADHDRDSDLWPFYVRVKESYSNFDMTKIHGASDIYPVFRKLFEKRKAGSK